MSYPLFELSPQKFPKRLREIADPPKKLYVMGTLPPEKHKWLCVVGARKYSPYGRDAVEKLISGLRGHPIAIVSGLALGIDALAHKEALRAGLPTVAVPGSGLGANVLYPSTNKPLAKQILESGGALLSEFDPDFSATQWSFPQRNRIMAGLCDAVLVIEAELKSGTLVTSKFATEYNRDVFTVPGSIFSSLSFGPHMLIRLGATPITGSAELLQALGFNETATLEFKNYDDCSPAELKIIELLKTPMSRDELIEALALPTSKANALLSVMEIKGLITEEVGEMHLV